MKHTFENMQRTVADAAMKIHKKTGAPCVLVIACSMDTTEPVLIGARIKDPLLIASVLERAAEYIGSQASAQAIATAVPGVVNVMGLTIDHDGHVIGGKKPEPS